MVERPISPFRRRLDRAGIALSGLCALHCVVSIMIVAGLGAGFGIGGELFLNPDIHRIGLVFAVLIAAVAIGWGALRHRKAAPFVIAMTGLTFMGGALAHRRRAGLARPYPQLAPFALRPMSRG